MAKASNFCVSNPARKYCNEYNSKDELDCIKEDRRTFNVDCSKTPTWQCIVCSFINTNTNYLSCEMCGQKREEKRKNNLHQSVQLSPYKSDSGRFSVISDLTDDDLSHADQSVHLPDHDLEIGGSTNNTGKTDAQNLIREEIEIKLSKELDLVDIALRSRAKILQKKRLILKNC